MKLNRYWFLLLLGLCSAFWWLFPLVVVCIIIGWLLHDQAEPYINAFKHTSKKATSEEDKT